jgi:hypothetical protein
MNNSQPDDNQMPEGMGGIGPLEMCYMDHTVLPLLLVSDIEEKLTDSGAPRITLKYDPNDLGIIYVSPNYDEPVYDSNRPDSAEDSPPLS